MGTAQGKIGSLQPGANSYWLEADLLPVLSHFLNSHRIEERHGGAEFLADNFHWVLGFGFAESEKLFAAGVLVGQEALGE